MRKIQFGETKSIDKCYNWTLETPKKQFNTIRNTMVSYNQQQWKKKWPTTIIAVTCLSFILHIDAFGFVRQNSTSASLKSIYVIWFSSLP